MLTLLGPEPQLQLVAVHSEEGGRVEGVTGECALEVSRVAAVEEVARSRLLQGKSGVSFPRDQQGKEVPATEGRDRS